MGHKVYRLLILYLALSLHLFWLGWGWGFLSVVSHFNTGNQCLFMHCITINGSYAIRSSSTARICFRVFWWGIQ